jgi:hypothetical protein
VNKSALAALARVALATERVEKWIADSPNLHQVADHLVRLD